MLITGDIHINTSKDEQFEVDRLLGFSKVLIATAKKKATKDIILAGDIFDKANPSLRDIRAFYKFIDALAKKHTIHLIAGNHEALTSSKKINDTIFDYLPADKYTYYKEPTELLIDGLYIRLIGHNALQSDVTYTSGDVLISHFRSGIKFAEDELDVDKISELYKYTIAGDIHTHYKPKHNIEYTAQPYNNHFGKPDSKNGFISLTPEGAEWIPTVLPNLYAVTYEEGKTPISFSDFINSLDTSVNRYKVSIKTQDGNYEDKNYNAIIKNVKGSGNITATYDMSEVDEQASAIVEDIIKSSGGKLDSVLTMLMKQYFPDDTKTLEVLTELGINTQIDLTKETDEK